MSIGKHLSRSSLGKATLRMETTLRMRMKEMRDQTGPGPTVWGWDRNEFETCSLSGFSSNWSKNFPLLYKPFWAGIFVNCNWSGYKPAGMISKIGKFGWGEERRRAKQTLRAFTSIIVYGSSPPSLTFFPPFPPPSNFSPSPSLSVFQSISGGRMGL